MPPPRRDDLEPEMALLVAILKLACRDAVQTRNPSLSREAWQFLDNNVPAIAAALRRKQERKKHHANAQPSNPATAGRERQRPHR